MKVKKNHRKRKQMKTLLELIADLLSCFNHCTDDGLKDDASNNTPGSVSNNRRNCSIWCTLVYKNKLL